MKPALIENGFKNEAKRSKMDQKTAKWSTMDKKWSQEEQKLEADRTRLPKTSPDSAEEPPRKPNQGYGV